MVTSLQEDPMLWQLEMELWELQHAYDDFRGTTQTISLTQLLVKIREARDLKEWVDVVQHKEVGLKACIQPWFEEAFMVTTTIEGKLT